MLFAFTGPNEWECYEVRMSESMSTMDSGVNTQLSPIMTIGDRLREERDRLGMNQEDFGAAGGVKRKSQFNYEAGERLPDAGYLSAIAELGVDVRWVITGSRDYEPPTPLSAEEQTLLAYWRQASGDTRKAAMGALVGARPQPAPRVLITGEVGQHVQGDLHLRSQTINMGGKKK